MRTPDDLPPFLRTIGEPSRLRILSLLARGEWSVGEIQMQVALAQNLVSHHLAALRKIGLVRQRRAGKHVYYRIEAQTLGEYLGALATLLDTRHDGPPP